MPGPNVIVSEAGTTAMASKPRKFVSGVGFRVRVSAVGVEEAAAVGPQVFDKLQRCDGSLGDRLELAFQRASLACRVRG